MNPDLGLSEEFVELLSKMLRHNPEERISMKEVLESDWLNKNIDEKLAKKDMMKNIDFVSENLNLKINLDFSKSTKD